MFGKVHVSVHYNIFIFEKYIFYTFVYLATRKVEDSLKCCFISQDIVCVLSASKFLKVTSLLTG